MRKLVSLVLLGGCLALFPHPEAAAQESPAFLAVGEMAPDFEVVGATRHGVLVDPISLSDLRGETVVLAFFFKARTGG